MAQNEHYLKTELYELVRRDPAIFEFLQAGSLDGIWYWDVTRQDQEWMSPRFKDLFGYRDDEIPNTSAWWMANIFPEDQAVALDNFARHLADPSHPYDQIVRYRHRDGSTVWVRCRGLAVRNEDGEPIRLLGCHTDVTALKRAEEDLRSQAAELRTARDAAENANRAKSTFLANVSHEIRTPLSAVVGTAELLGDTALTPTQHEYLDAIRESADALLDVINDLLDFSKMEAGKLTLERRAFHLRGFVDSLLKSLAPRLRRKDVALRCAVADDAPDALVGDARLLRQILSNLVSNAIKFTERGEIVLRARPLEQADGKVSLGFEVADTGIGISPDKQKVIFEEFVQADASTTRRYGGTGLGLAIASRLVDALGGRIGLRSEPGRGSTFHFTATFDRGAARARERPREHPPVVVLRPLRVLLVEDSVPNQRVAVGMLEKAGHAVRVAATGTQAVEACAAEQFDVVLMDMQMPEMDGFEATRAIRGREQEQGGGRTPIIALTARSSRGHGAHWRSVGFDGYLAKPYRSRDLLEAIAASVAGAAPTGGARVPPAVGRDSRARVDWDAALESVEGDRELLRKVVDGFLGQQPSLCIELRGALQAGDLPVVQRVAHTVGGSLRLFHGARVVSLANDLEDCCQDGESGRVATCWQALDRELATVVAELREWIRSRP